MQDLLMLEGKLKRGDDKLKLRILINGMLSGNFDLKTVIKFVQRQIDGTRKTTDKNPTFRTRQTKTWELVREIFKKHLTLDIDAGE